MDEEVDKKVDKVDKKVDRDFAVIWRGSAVHLAGISRGFWDNPPGEM